MESIHILQQLFSLNFFYHLFTIVGFGLNCLQSNCNVSYFNLQKIKLFCCQIHSGQCRIVYTMSGRIYNVGSYVQCRVVYTMSGRIYNVASYIQCWVVYTISYTQCRVVYTMSGRIYNVGSYKQCRVVFTMSGRIYNVGSN